MVLVHKRPGTRRSSHQHQGPRSRSHGPPRHRARASAGTCPASPAAAASWFPRRPRTCALPGLTADHQIQNSRSSPPLSSSSRPRRAGASDRVASWRAGGSKRTTTHARPPDCDRQLLLLAWAGLVRANANATSDQPPAPARDPWPMGTGETSNREQPSPVPCPRICWCLVLHRPE